MFEMFKCCLNFIQSFRPICLFAVAQKSDIARENERQRARFLLSERQNEMKTPQLYCQLPRGPAKGLGFSGAME